MKFTFGIFITIFSIVIVSCNTIKLETRQQLITENNTLRDSLAFYKQQLLDIPEAVFELENMNVVYRGVNNPMKIAVPNSINYVAIAPGLKNIGNGHFNLRPQLGKEVTIRIVAQMKNGKKLKFNKVFRIEDIGNIRTFFNGKLFQNQAIELTKREISEGQISVDIENYLPYKKQKVTSFKALFLRKNRINIEGNKFSEEAIKELNNMSIGDTIFIHQVKIPYSNSHGLRFCKPGLKIIKIVE